MESLEVTKYFDAFILIRFLLLTSEGHSLDSCIKADNPSTSNKKCVQFKEVMGPEKMPTKGNTVLIMYGKKKRKTICYPEDPCAATKGWCGTCIRNAKYGEYGYCQVKTKVFSSLIQVR